MVIYDGHCRICRAQIERLASWDRGGRLAFVSLHDPLVAQRYPDLSHEELMRQMVVVDHRGKRHRGAEAVRWLARRLPTLWWLCPVLHLPGTLPLWRWLYRQIADRRYRWGQAGPCEDGTCRLHGKG